MSSAFMTFLLPLLHLTAHTALQAMYVHLQGEPVVPVTAHIVNLISVSIALSQHH